MRSGSRAPRPSETQGWGGNLSCRHLSNSRSFGSERPARSECKPQRELGLLQIVSVEDFAEIRRTGGCSRSAPQVRRSEEVERLSLRLDSESIAYVDGPREHLRCSGSPCSARDPGHIV